MKLQAKFAVATVALMLGGLGAAPAFAGEGGAAGAASFQLSGGVVQNAAVAGAIGKVSAYAGATNTSSGFFGFNRDLDAFAVGTAGPIGFTGSSVYITNVGTDPNPLLPQVNQLNANQIDINGTSGSLSVH